MKRASVVDVQRFIDEHPFGRFQRLIFFMCFVIVLLDGFRHCGNRFHRPVVAD
jgi:AAHS family 4-hydroxybenzoate transporter-like MFS transporter